jgi:hypothetical protein
LDLGREASNPVRAATLTVGGGADNNPALVFSTRDVAIVIIIILGLRGGLKGSIYGDAR